jgi:predicted DNA-binding transcriptional regulator YafY
MRDKKDNATFDLPGFEPTPHDAAAVVPAAATSDTSVDAAPASKRTRARRAAQKQEQLMLLDLEKTDATGLPVWNHDPDLDLTGLPIWKPAA